MEDSVNNLLTRVVGAAGITGMAKRNGENMDMFLSM